MSLPPDHASLNAAGGEDAVTNLAVGVPDVGYTDSRTCHKGRSPVVSLAGACTKPWNNPISTTKVARPLLAGLGNRNNLEPSI